MPRVLQGRGVPVAEVPVPGVRAAGRLFDEPDVEYRPSFGGVCRELRHRRPSAEVGEGVDIRTLATAVLPDDPITADGGVELFGRGRNDRHLLLLPYDEVAEVNVPRPAPLVLPGDEVPVDCRGDLPAGVFSDPLLSCGRIVEIEEVDIGSAVPVVFPDDPAPRYRRVGLSVTVPGDLPPLSALDIVQPDIPVPGALLPDDVPLRERGLPSGHRRTGEEGLAAGLDSVEADIRAPAPGIVPNHMLSVNDGHPLVGRIVGERRRHAGR